MKNKKYKMESFRKYFYDINPSVENQNLINKKQYMDVFDNFRNEYNTLHDLHIEIKEIFHEINKK